MNIASFELDGIAGYGVVCGAELLDCSDKLRSRYADLKNIIAADGFAVLSEAMTEARRLPIEAVKWLPVIPNPDKILCVGLNYEMHRQETGRSEVENPTIFTRFADTQTGHGTDLQLPRVSNKFDYEGELAVIIGRAGRYIAREAALSHVAGYAIYNDGSIRDYQQHSHQYTPGKNFPATAGFGPWMVTAEAFGVPATQRIQTRLNGEVVQDAHLSDMIFDTAQVIAYCSRFTTLHPGDVIAMGTPGGVGMKRTPPLWMKLGDRVEVEIEGIGILANEIGPERLS